MALAPKQLQFTMPDGHSIEDIKAKLHDYLNYREQPTQLLQRTFYDSFDWRVYAQGGTLEIEHYNSGLLRLLWRSRSQHDLYSSQQVEQVPRFVADLPTGPLHQRLLPVLQMRALLAQVTVRSRRHVLKVLNQDLKTVATIVLEDNRVAGDKRAPQLNRIRLLPVKGYRKTAKRIQRVLTGKLALAAPPEDLLTAALSVIGRQPQDYSSKLDLYLDPEMRADSAAKLVLRHLLQTMTTNEAGTRDDLDSEFLHDFRVAVRRSRSALSQIKDVFPARVLNRFQREFAWLGQITSLTRDLDVYLLKFDDYRTRLPVAVRSDLDPLRVFLQDHQQTEQRNMVKQLDSARYQQLLDAWETFLQAPVPKRTTLANATRPIGEVASERIWRVYRRTCKQGRAIQRETPAEALHELRKTCKKLRYLMEFFQSLYPPAKIKKLIKTLKILQENLGDFQDLEVQATQLKHFAGQMMEESKVSADTLLAMGMLVENLGQRQQQTRDVFAARFAEFERPQTRALFKGLFKAS